MDSSRDQILKEQEKLIEDQRQLIDKLQEDIAFMNTLKLLHANNLKTMTKIIYGAIIEYMDIKDVIDLIPIDEAITAYGIKNVLNEIDDEKIMDIKHMKHDDRRF